jgi:putative lipoprotein
VLTAAALSAAALAATALLASCAGNPNLPPPANWVSGHVTYRERVALPSDAELRVALIDASRPDSAAAPVADTVIHPGGRQVPLPFVLRFDPRRIDRGRDYAIRATITAGGRLAFMTPGVVKVVTRDHPNMVDLVLTRAQDPGATAGEPLPPSLAGVWVLEDIGGTGVIDNARATLEFRDASRAAGRGSCNQFSGPVTVADSTISFGPLASTRMACAEAVMNQENRYFKALGNAERYAIEGPSLLIYAKGSDRPLRFTREKP